MASLPIIKSEYEDNKAKQESSSPFKQNYISNQNNNSNNSYDYFNTKLPKSSIDNLLKTEKDERYVYFLKYGILRRYDGDGDILFVEIPQIPKKLVIYRKPFYKSKTVDRLYLNNLDLPHLPLFEGEENLRLLSLEGNNITKIDHLVSLNSLLYLNFYCNKITEIENLQNVVKLKALMLGKNNIEKIKNLSCLPDLEVLDLHSNKIKLIENLSSLKKLRLLNLANNLITSFHELSVNKNLEELNLRKNLIVTIPPSISNLEKLRKINIGKNMISKTENIIELKKLKNIVEVVIEENPVLVIKESQDILKTLPVRVKIKTPIVNTNNISNNPNYIGNLATSITNITLPKTVNNNSLLNNINNMNNSASVLEGNLTLQYNNSATNKDMSGLIQLNKMKQKINDRSLVKHNSIVAHSSGGNSISNNNGNMNNSTNNNSFIKQNSFNNNLNTKNNSFINQNGLSNLNHINTSNSIGNLNNVNLKSVQQSISPNANSLLNSGSNNTNINSTANNNNNQLNLNNQKQNNNTNNSSVNNQNINSSINYNNTNINLNPAINKDMNYMDEVIKHIQNEWQQEKEYILNNGYNGYNIKRLKETKIFSGHAELEDNVKLNIYGNALKVLNQEEFYPSIDTISVYYFNIDLIMNRKILERLKKFKKLKKLCLSNNNLHSYYQLIKFEECSNIEVFELNDNEVCNSNLLRYFLIYRFQYLKNVNGVEITTKDKSVSKKIFEYFDTCISVNETNNSKRKEEEKKAGVVPDPKENSSTNNKMLEMFLDKRHKNKEKQKLFNYVEENIDDVLNDILEEE